MNDDGDEGDRFDPGKININFFKWRPILRGLITLEEYDNHCSLKDLMDANEALDIMDEHDKWENKRARAEADARRLAQT